MSDDRIEAIEQLLHDTERAHGVYEATELSGVYDAEWARWYAAYALDHGIGGMMDRPVDADELAARLAAGFAEFDGIDPKPAEGWARFVARRLVEDG